MKKFKKEILAILCGSGFAYGWQLFALFMSYIADPNDGFVTADKFIPWWTIQLAMAPMATWIFMGLFRVNWFKTWFKITACGLSFFLPFALIIGVTVITAPSYLSVPMYWFSIAFISLLLAFTLFRSLHFLKYSN